MFTEYRDTQRWLHERLIGGGIPAERIAQLYGGQDEDEREHVKSVFQESRSWTRCGSCWPPTPPARASTCRPTATGCCTGRSRGTRTGWSSATAAIDRHGQHAPEVDVFHFVPAGWQDGGRGSRTGSALEDELYFLYVAAKKVEQIREDLGSAGEVIAAQVEQKMLGKRADWQTADVEIARRASQRRAEDQPRAGPRPAAAHRHAGAKAAAT